MNYYNENDPFAAQWLRNLIQANLIPLGFVDERSILDVKPNDLANYTQCHFFAGIAGWSIALSLAAWPIHKPVWTGSCPCQPFSAAGKAGGFADERHLWPYWFHLIEQCRPQQIFGEQVASKAGLEWYDLVRSDLEGASYSVACADLCAASVGAPHIRQRLWFVADAMHERVGPAAGNGHQTQGEAFGFDGGSSRTSPSTRIRRASGNVADTQGGDGRLSIQPGRPSQENFEPTRRSEADGELGDANEPRLQRRRIDLGEHTHQRITGETSEPCIVGNAEGDGERQSRLGEASYGRTGSPGGSGTWSNLEWLPCTDGKARPTQPGIFPLLNGVQSIMDSVFSIQERALMEVKLYAENSGANPREILQMVREAICQGQSGERATTRMRSEFYATQVLFDFLCCLETACDGTADGRRGKKAGAEIIGRTVRSVRRDGGIVRASRQRRPEGQCTDKSPAALHELSFVLACLSEAHATEAINAHAASVRAKLLRGPGNAIVPQVAAEFIKAYMDCRP